MYVNTSLKSVLTIFLYFMHIVGPITESAKAIQKVKNVCAYSPHTCFLAADHWFLVFKIASCRCTSGKNFHRFNIWSKLTFIFSFIQIIFNQLQPSFTSFQKMALGPPTLEALQLYLTVLEIPCPAHYHSNVDDFGHNCSYRIIHCEYI